MYNEYFFEIIVWFSIPRILYKFLVPQSKKKKNLMVSQIFLNHTLVIFSFYRSTSFVSDILSEVKVLNPNDIEFGPSFISFNTQYQKGEMVAGLKWLIST